MIDERLHESASARCRAFARPAEFRRGQALSQQDLIVRLNDLGYADRPRVTQPGEFSGYRNVITPAPRSGELAGKTVSVTFPPGRATETNPNPLAVVGFSRSRWLARAERKSSDSIRRS